MLLALPSGAVAEQITVSRHVTLRTAPSSHSSPITYPDVGSQLELLNEGVRSHGYYRARLPDGREGWIYSTFVHRELSQPAGLAMEPTPAPAGDHMTVHFIDVDQGNSALLEFSCGAVLIDAGGWGTPLPDDADFHYRPDDRGPIADHLVGYLRHFFEGRPDLHNRLAAVIVTHEHIDHNRYLQRVMQGPFQVGGYVHNGSLSWGKSGAFFAHWAVDYAPTASPPIPVEAVTEVEVTAAGNHGVTDSTIDPVPCPGVDPVIRVLSGGRQANPGWSSKDFANENNHSLVVRVDYGASSFLFTGDMEEPAMRSLVARYSGTNLLDADVWLVGHHGSANGTIPELLAAVTPEVAIISMGSPVSHQKWTAWAYGHPRRGILDMLENGVSRLRSTPVHVQAATGQHVFVDYPIRHAIYASGWNGDIDVTATPAGAIAVRTSR